MSSFKPNYFQRRSKPQGPKANERIRALDVQVIGSDGGNLGAMPLNKAIELAKQEGLDLIEISPNARPPVCKIIDYKKFLYEQKRKQKELKAKQVKVVIKEIRFGPNTDEHDFQFKLKHAIKFLSEGAKLKAFVFFKGRSIVYKDRGEILLLKFAQELEEYGVLEKMPELQGKKMTIMINPKKK